MYGARRSILKEEQVECLRAIEWHIWREENIVIQLLGLGRTDGDSICGMDLVSSSCLHGFYVIQAQLRFLFLDITRI